MTVNPTARGGHGWALQTGLLGNERGGMGQGAPRERNGDELTPGRALRANSMRSCGEGLVAVPLIPVTFPSAPTCTARSAFTKVTVLPSGRVGSVISPEPGSMTGSVGLSAHAVRANAPNKAIERPPTLMASSSPPDSTSDPAGIVAQRPSTG